MKRKKKIHDIEKIEIDYKNGLTYKELAKKYKTSFNQVTYLEKKNKWQRESNLSVTHLGNQNAVGNSGGPGAEEGNKRALTTGEYETIFFDVLSEEEKSIYKKLEIDNKRTCIEQEYKMLCIREYRILKRINKYKTKKRI